MATKSEIYWAQRQAEELYQQLRTAEDVAGELKQSYLIAARAIEQEAFNLVKRFQLANHLSQAEAYRLLEKVKSPDDIKRMIAELKKNPQNVDLALELEAQAYATRIRDLASLMNTIDLTCVAIFNHAEPKMRALLERIGHEMYYRQIFAMQQRSGWDFSFKTLTPERIANILNRNWSGSGNFSKALWGNTKRLAKQVKEELIVNLLTGRPPQKMVESINARFSARATDVRRLVRTECNYVANQLQMESYKECGVEKYIYVAILDLRTSKICRGLDKKRFLVSSARVGLNYPPMHPWCRSTTIAWIPDELFRTLKQRAYDPKTGRNKIVSGDMTYEQWYKENAKQNNTQKMRSDMPTTGS